MIRLRAFMASMAGRVFTLLVVGLAMFSGLALILEEAKRRLDVERYDLEMTAERVADFVSTLNGVPGSELRVHRDILTTPGTRMASENDRSLKLDRDTSQFLAARLNGSASEVQVREALVSTCVPLAAQRDASVPPKCWLVSLKLPDGTPIRIAVNTPLHLAVLAESSLVTPLYLAILAIGFAVMAFFAARMSALPLSELSSAAKALSEDIDSAPLTEHGPTEVRNAARAFNAMQVRLRQTLNERMQMLAAITHDLQTPLTRLRLRLEKVEDRDLRDRLVADLSATQNLVDEGLDLARSSAGTIESAVRLDLDSLLASMVEDEVDAGRKVSLQGRCGRDVLAAPQSLRRCLTNLLDNALKYTGAAVLFVEASGDEVDIHVLDDGPGLPPDQLEEVFKPFVRLETSRSRETGGTGLGLTIARALAHQNGGRLALKNREGGGLDVILTLPCDNFRHISALA